MLETDEDGDPIETTEAETDEDGDPHPRPKRGGDGRGWRIGIEPVEPETDEDGNPSETEEYETDEFGMIVPRREQHAPGHTSESESQSRHGPHGGERQPDPPRPDVGELRALSRTGAYQRQPEPPGRAGDLRQLRGGRPPRRRRTSRAPIVNSPTRPGSGGDHGRTGAVRGESCRDPSGSPLRASTGDGVILPPSTIGGGPGDLRRRRPSLPCPDGRFWEKWGRRKKFPEEQLDNVHGVRLEFWKIDYAR